MTEQDRMTSIRFWNFVAVSGLMSAVFLAPWFSEQIQIYLRPKGIVYALGDHLTETGLGIRVVGSLLFAVALIGISVLDQERFDGCRKGCLITGLCLLLGGGLLFSLIFEYLVLRMGQDVFVANVREFYWLQMLGMVCSLTVSAIGAAMVYFAARHKWRAAWKTAESGETALRKRFQMLGLALVAAGALFSNVAVFGRAPGVRIHPEILSGCNLMMFIGAILLLMAGRAKAEAKGLSEERQSEWECRSGTAFPPTA